MSIQNKECIYIDFEVISSIHLHQGKTALYAQVLVLQQYVNENLNFDIKVNRLSIQETKGKLLEGKKYQPTVRAKLF